MEILITSRKTVIEKLLEGRELANELHSVIAHKKYSDGSSVVAVTTVENLVTKILKSFSNTLYILNVDSELVDDISVFQILPDSLVNLSCLDPAKSVDSRESRRSTTTNFTIEDRRGCQKKRRLASQSTWNRQTRTLIDDGHAWRKYGQKVIMNAKYHRNYFRCTHKDYQNCQATKQVQRIQEDPPLYQTTYYDHHTCKSPELILECCTSPSRDRKPSTLISFERTDHTNKQDHPFLSLFSSINKHDEFKEEMSLCDHIMKDKQSSLSDYVILPDPMEFESPMAMTVLSSPIDYDSEDVISTIMESVDFDYDVLQFEFLMGT